MQPLLEIKDLCVSFTTRKAEIPAIKGFSCKIMSQEALGLVGESGCGKSTVAFAIMRYLGNNGRIKSGSIKFKGKELTTLAEEDIKKIRGGKIAMVYQEPMSSLNPSMIVAKQLAEVPMLRENITYKQATEKVEDMLKSVRLPDVGRLMGSFPHQLSGGQQQRVVIAMALLAKPELLILDEPTTALDVTVEAGIIKLIREIVTELKTSCLFISHNLGLILETCDNITIMYSGEAVEEGEVKNVFESMRHPYTKGLFNSIPLPMADKNAKPLRCIPGQLPLPHERPEGCNFAARCDFFKKNICDQEIEMHKLSNKHYSRCARVQDIDWEKPLSEKKQREPIKIGRPLLEVKDAKKYYRLAANEIFGGKKNKLIKANENITFNAREAETLAVVGESGCGKSTIAKMILGIEKATGGTIKIDGESIENISVENRNTKIISTIQMIFQNPFDTLNPSKNIGSQIIRTLERFDVGNSYEERRKIMHNLLEVVRLPKEFEYRMPRQLSGGQKQRISIARAFSGSPKIVVADEPVSALDVSVQASVTELLMDVQRDYRTTIIFISHDISLVRYIADRVIVMYLGYIVEQGTTDEVFQPPYHPYTEALLSAVPIADPTIEKEKILLEGNVPSAIDRPKGCPFQTRCHRKDLVPDNLCEKEIPPIRMIDGKHEIRCHLHQDIFDQMKPIIKQKKTA